MAWHEMTAGMRSDGEQSIRENFWRQPRTYPWMLEIGVLAMVITSLWVKQVYFSIAQRATWSPSEETFWHWSQTHSSVFSLSLAILMLLFGLFPLIPRYWRFALLHVLNLFLTSLIVADFIHARFFGAAISVLSLYNAHMLGAVVPSIVESIRPSYLILYLDVILGIIALPYYWRACRNAPGLRRKHTGPVSLALVAAGLLLVAVGFVGTLVAVHLVPDGGTAWATLAPLLVGGLGAGLVISPNQALTLSEVPVERAGTAGGLLQVGQRIGAAVGIAAVGSVFFARVAATRGDFAGAYQHGMLVATAFVVAALVLAVVDVVVDRRVHRSPG